VYFFFFQNTDHHKNNNNNNRILYLDERVKYEHMLDEAMLVESGGGGKSETTTSSPSPSLSSSSSQLVVGPRFSQDLSFLVFPQNAVECALCLTLAFFAITVYHTFSSHPNELLKTHIFSMTGAFGVCLPLGALIALKLRRFDDLRRTRALIVHAFVQSLGVFFFSCGVCAIYENKVRKGSDHFTTLHSKFGLLTLFVSVFGAVAFGVIGFKKTGVARVAKMSEHAVAQTKKYHRNSGTAVVLLSWVTITLAFHHPAVTDATVNYLIVFWYILMLIAATAFIVVTRGPEPTRVL
jgi:hypothetical protein